MRSGEFGSLPGEGLPQVVRYGVHGDEAARFGLPCGGTLELMLEPVTVATAIDGLLAQLDDGRHLRRKLRLASGHVTLAALDAAHDADSVRLDGATLMSTHGPHWRLLVIGAGQMTRYLAEMASALDYQVTVCDPRTEYTAEFAWPRGLKKRARTPPEIAVAILAELTAARYGFRIPEPVRITPARDDLGMRAGAPDLTLA